MEHITPELMTHLLKYDATKQHSLVNPKTHPLLLLRCRHVCCYHVRVCGAMCPRSWGPVRQSPQQYSTAVARRHRFSQRQTRNQASRWSSEPWKPVLRLSTMHTRHRRPPLPRWPHHTTPRARPQPQPPPPLHRLWLHSRHPSGSPRPPSHPCVHFTGTSTTSVWSWDRTRRSLAVTPLSHMNPHHARAHPPTDARSHLSSPVYRRRPPPSRRGCARDG